MSVDQVGVESAAPLPDEKPKPKDAWDKLSILSSFIASVVLISVGGTFTFFYQHFEKVKEEARQAEELRLKGYAERTRELDAVSKLVPFLASTDENTKRIA